MEIYREVQGFEGLYEVSNYGNVKSLKYGKERILKPTDNGHGYLYVSLWKNDKAKKYKVHRLVANAFIENPDELPEVNHRDEDKTNNCAENLEWCSHEYNHRYGTINQRIAEAHRGMTKPWVAETLTNGKRSIPVDMLTKDGELIRTFPSCMEAERWLQINGYPSASVGNINKCCKGNPNYTHAYGFKWRYSYTK